MSGARHIVSLTALLLLGCAEADSGEQLPAPVPIAEWASRVDTLPGTYTRVMKPAEFHDSLLIVPDVMERLLWRINMRDGTRSRFGSQGGGPGEYERVGWAGKVHHDSVAIYQRPTGPFPIIDVVTERGRANNPSRQSEDQHDAAVFSVVSQPGLRHADTLGRVYGAPTAAPPVLDSVTGRVLRAGGLMDTAPIVRYTITNGRIDTLLSYATGNRTGGATRDARGALTKPMSLGAYGTYDGWHVTPAGDMLVVDAATYTVRVVDANTHNTREFTLAWTPVAVSDSGWDAHVQSTTKGSIAFLEKSMRDISVQIDKPMPRPQEIRYIVPEKPTYLPPVNFGGYALHLFSTNDVAWIPVHRTEPPVTAFYDLVDFKRGVRITTVELLANHRLLHVTALGAYVAATDHDDLERILLYRAGRGGIVRR